LTQEEKEILVKENRWVVNDVINKYTHLMERDELEAAGLLGLIEGIEKFKTGHGAKISTYVRHWIKARVLAVVYENRIVHVPWNKINSYIKAQKSETESVGISGQHRSVNFHSRLSSYTPKFEISLDAFSTTNDEDGSSDNIEIQSSLSSEDLSMMEENHTAAHVNFAIEKSDLSMLEKKAITLRFGLNRREDPMTFSQVGTLTGLSTMGAQKAVIRGLKKLKNNSYIKELIE
tara:strand:+ start:5047 stop:5745 length:699 start_codon:yes stop_codon:yes gene_type:complete